jgi:hypothetical protein
MDVGQIANLIVALATLVAAVTGLVKAWKTTKKLDNVEQLVNGNHHIALARIDQLGESLTNAGVAIPNAPNVEVGKGNAV